MDAIKRLFAGPVEDEDGRIAEMTVKIDKLRESVSTLKGQLAGYTESRAERDLYRTLMRVISEATDFEGLLSVLVDALADLLHARYGAVFLLDPDTDLFSCSFSRGYASERFPEIPRNRSAMGQCLKTRGILWEPDFRAKADFFVNLGQDPGEYNVLMIPVILFNTETAVIRLANVDEKGEVIASTVIRDAIPLISSQLERLKLLHRNEQAYKRLDASFSIARLLENTLDEADILRNLCAKIPRLVPARACIIALSDESGHVRPAVTWPNGFHLGGNPQSETIYLRNLLQAWPEGTAMISDIRRDRRWSWPVPDVKSLCMVPIRQRSVIRGLIIIVGPAHEVYEDVHMKYVGLAAAQASVTLERAAYFRRQEELASCDGLTGLLNHRMFQEMVRAEMDRSSRYGRPLTLLLFDIDHFKKFNDTYGHPVGDEVIKMVARAAKASGRTTDKVFRYGGEEFCVLLPETAVESATVLAERIRSRIEADRSVNGLSVTVSLGVTQFHPGEGAEPFIDRTDRGMYASKEGGRNRFTVMP